MTYQDITNITFAAFQEAIRGKKVVLLYPRISYRSLFLNYFLDDPQRALLYYRIPQTQGDTEWLAGLRAELSTAGMGFGQQLAVALTGTSPEDLGQALAADLNMFADQQPVVLFLDEVDRVQQGEAFRRLMQALVTDLTDRVLLVIGARTLTREPWSGFIQQGEAVVFGTEHRSGDLIFTPAQPDQPHLEVYAFGRGEVLVNGQEIDTWDGALPRNLFFYFIDNDMVTRDQIFAVFWPELKVKEATNVFHVTKRKITERISSKIPGGKSYELTRYREGFYRAADGIIRHYDVADFEAAVDEALMTFDEDRQAALLRRAIRIYRAPFLQSIDMPWVVDRRQRLREKFITALVELARVHLRRSEHERVLGLFLRSLRESPQREDIHREVMSIYHRLGWSEDALRQYERLKEYLQETLGVPPSRETRELYEAIRSSVQQA